MTEEPQGAPPPSTPAREDEAGWRRMHPLSPLLRGGLVVIVIASIVIANLRDRLIELFFGDQFSDEGGDVVDLFDYLAQQRLVLVALLAVLAVLAIIVFFAWLSWRFQTFRITGEAVEERSGVVFRQHRRAPLERIQSVNLQRPLLARVLGLTQIDVQTAGQGGKVALRYLGHAQAKEVREQILRASVGSRGDEAGSEGAAALAGAAAAAGPEIEPSPSGLPAELDRRARDFADLDIDAEARRAGSLVQVPAGRLIGSILLSWDLLIPAALLVGTIVAGSTWQVYAFGLTVPILLALGGIGFSHFNRGWGFTLSRSADGVRVGAGLTATNTETVPLARIHAVEARQPLAWRPFGWWKVVITTAGHSLAQGGQNRLQNAVLPVGVEEDALRVLETVLPGQPDREALREALTGGGAGYLGAGSRAGWVLWAGRRRAGLTFDGVRPETVGGVAAAAAAGDAAAGAPADEAHAQLRIRRGALTRSLSIMPLVRAQSVQLRRPLVHRLLGLASIQAHTVLGPVRMEMRGIALDRARWLFDRLAAAVVRVQAAETAQRHAERGRGRGGGA